MPKATIIAVTPSGIKFGENKDKEIFFVITNPPSPAGVYKTFHQNMGEKIGQELEFTTEEKEYQGKKEYILHLPKTGAPMGGGKRGFQPREESELSVMQRHSAMCWSYAKDLAVAYIQGGHFPDSTKSMSLVVFLQTMYQATMGETVKVMKPYIKGPQEQAKPVAPPKPVEPVKQASRVEQPPLKAYDEGTDLDLPTEDEIPFR